jgi:hypothetical protein
MLESINMERLAIQRSALHWPRLGAADDALPRGMEARRTTRFRAALADGSRAAHPLAS